MTHPLPPTDSPAGIADGEIEELRKTFDKIYPLSESDYFPEDPDCSECRICDATILVDSCCEATPICDDCAHEVAEKMHDAFPKLIARLKRAEAERDENERLIEKEFRPRLDGYSEGLKGKNDRIASLESERDRLREALEPFAKAAPLLEKWHDMSWLCADNESNDWPVCERRTSITVEDIRMAAAALADAGKGGGDAK